MNIGQMLHPLRFLHASRRLCRPLDELDPALRIGQHGLEPFLADSCFQLGQCVRDGRRLLLAQFLRNLDGCGHFVCRPILALCFNRERGHRDAIAFTVTAAARFIVCDFCRQFSFIDLLADSTFSNA
ncbi:hypothetical protein D3C76_1459760 [compost metagenome]